MGTQGVTSQAPTSAAVVSPELSWPESADATYGLVGKDNKTTAQTAEARLSAQLSLYSYRPSLDTDDAQKFLLVSLQGSVISASTSGSIAWDGDSLRGWYTEAVDVTMQWADSPAGELVLADDQPETSDMQASASTSTAIDFSLGGGLFGATGTGSASVGGSISNSWSENLTDFAIVNTSTEAGGTPIVRHRLKLAAVEGHSYAGAGDLVTADTGTTVATALSDAFYAAFGFGHTVGRALPLYKLPDRAKTNVALVSQALFRSPKPLVAKRTLNVTVTHTLAAVMTAESSSAHKGASWSTVLSLLVDFNAV
jgi:hypothetical protein